MKATVLVRPKAGILDPQGQAVEGSLRQLGFAVGEANVAVAPANGFAITASGLMKFS